MIFDADESTGAIRAWAATTARSESSDRDDMYNNTLHTCLSPGSFLARFVFCPLCRYWFCQNAPNRILERLRGMSRVLEII